MAGITVSGEGRASAPADTVVVSVRVSVGRPSVAEAVSGAAAVATALRAALGDVGVSGADVATTGYHLAPEHDPDDHRRVIGYRAEHTLAVTVRDLERAGDVLDSTVGAAGDDVRVDGLAFEVTDRAAVAAAARRLAWEDALARARQLADHAGLALGAAIEIRETVEAAPGPMPRMALAAMEASTPIAPGGQSTAVAVTVTFAVDS